jgi:exosortase
MSEPALEVQSASSVEDAAPAVASSAVENSSSDTESQPLYLGLSAEVWTKIGVLTVLFCSVFWPNLRRLWEKTNPFYGEPNWGHAMCVPVIGLYFLYVNREALLSAPQRTSWTGLVILILGLLLFVYGIYPGQNDFVKDFGMVVTLFGMVLLLAGWAVMKITWFPIAFLVCALPWPGLVYSQVAGPLQQLAANVAVDALNMTGVTAYASGTKIEIYGHDNAERTLNVAEACAGLRSLMTFISVAAAVAFLSGRSLWQKLLIVASAVPIAIFCNVMRVTGQGLLDHYVSQQLSENFAHQFVGLIMLLPAFLLILAVGWALDQMFVEEADRRHHDVHPLLRRPTPALVTIAPPPVARAMSEARPARQGPRSFSPRGLPPQAGAGRSYSGNGGQNGGESANSDGRRS